MSCRTCRWLKWCCTLAAVVALAGVGSGQQPKPNIEQLREAADKGDAKAQYALGFQLEKGQGMTRDVKEAANWYARAAAQGHPMGMKAAAASFAVGRGLPAEPNEAVKQIDAVLAKSPTLIKSTTLKPGDKFRFFRDITTAYFKLNADKDRKIGYDKVLAALDKHAARTALRYTVEGDFFTTYAWDGRGTKFADMTNDEQLRVFEERLKLAAEALEKAWELDNKSAEAATRRITVAMGLSEMRPVMERWFERAMKADADNIAACRAKMRYLEPKWKGDDQGRDMEAFGRECLKGGNWKARIPFLLIEAHETLSKYPRGDRGDKFARNLDARYFALPGVWTDMTSVYEPYLKLNPKAHADRTKYAMFAAWAGEWTVANAQFQQLGDNLVTSVFDSPDELDRLRREAARKAR